MATALRWTIRGMMWFDHLSFVQIGPLVGELWHFQHIPMWRPSAILNFIFYIWSRDCHRVPYLLLCANFIKTGSRVRPPDAHLLIYWMRGCQATALTMVKHHGGHVGMRPPKFRPNRSIGSRVIAFNTFSKMAAVHHRELDFFSFWTTYE